MKEHLTARVVCSLSPLQRPGGKLWLGQVLLWMYGRIALPFCQGGWVGALGASKDRGRARGGVPRLCRCGLRSPLRACEGRGEWGLEEDQDVRVPSWGFLPRWLLPRHLGMLSADLL